MTARELKDRLYARHPATASPMPGPWTCVDEWRGIDVVAFSAWSSASQYARIGYEVKVSRADLRRELLRPWKRALSVEWCNEFYFAVPDGLLTKDEIAYAEPEWQSEDFHREVCPHYSYGYGYHGRYRTRCAQRVPVPWVLQGRESYDRKRYWGGPWTTVPCPTCGGRGTIGRSRVEIEAPTCWVPADVGLVVVNGRGTRVVKRSPRRSEVPGVSAKELGQLVRWVSIRPDPRHHAAAVPLDLLDATEGERQTAA